MPEVWASVATRPHRPGLARCSVEAGPCTGQSCAVPASPAWRETVRVKKAAKGEESSPLKTSVGASGPEQTLWGQAPLPPPQAADPSVCLPLPFSLLTRNHPLPVPSWCPEARPLRPPGGPSCWGRELPRRSWEPPLPGPKRCPTSRCPGPPQDGVSFLRDSWVQWTTSSPTQPHFSPSRLRLLRRVGGG